MDYNKLMEKPHEDDKSDHNEGFLSLNRIARNSLKRSWRTWLIGRPLATADAPHQTVNKVVGLAVFGADALSSIAYAPQETLVILAAAGAQDSSPRAVRVGRRGPRRRAGRAFRRVAGRKQRHRRETVGALGEDDSREPDRGEHRRRR